LLQNSSKTDTKDKDSEFREIGTKSSLDLASIEFTELNDECFRYFNERA